MSIFILQWCNRFKVQQELPNILVWKAFTFSMDYCLELGTLNVVEDSCMMSISLLAYQVYITCYVTDYFNGNNIMAH